MEFNQARVNGGSNYDALKVAKEVKAARNFRKAAARAQERKERILVGERERKACQQEHTRRQAAWDAAAGWREDRAREKEQKRMQKEVAEDQSVVVEEFCSGPTFFVMD